MLYVVLEKKLKALPQPALEEVAAYIDYISFKFSKRASVLYIPI